MNYCDSPYRFQRRETRPVTIGDTTDGGVVVGGSEPIVRQSMITCSTLNTEASVEQSMALVDVGCQIVRITAQTKRYAANLEHIVAGIRDRGSNVPVVADIHFKPDAAMEAVKWCEMVRVNPGNYADSKSSMSASTVTRSTPPNWRASRRNSLLWSRSAKRAIGRFASAPITAR